MKKINFRYASKVVNKMRPILKLYRGYANEQELIVMGHVLNQRKRLLIFKNLKNAWSVIGLFRLKHNQIDVYLVITIIKYIQKH
jgi:hypothetical protein